nr:MAG TPA: hypothetical protein [Bacteriophage sp.]
MDAERREEPSDIKFMREPSQRRQRPLTARVLWGSSGTPGSASLIPRVTR